MKRIRDETSGSVKLRTDYMKLLLFTLQRQKLVGVFADDPVKYDKLEEFPTTYDVRHILINISYIELNLMYHRKFVYLR